MSDSFVFKVGLLMTHAGIFVLYPEAGVLIVGAGVTLCLGTLSERLFK